MADFCLGLLLSLLFLMSAWGWGQAIRHFVRVPLMRLGAFTAVTGLAWLAFLGGILNVADQARSRVLVSVILLGAVMAVAKVLRQRPWQRKSGPQVQPSSTTRLVSALPTAIACAVATFACAVLMPTSVFNFHDDFQTYLPRVVRMIESGSIAGNAFDGMGLDSLGTQSFFQGYFIALGGPRMANGFDAVCCLFLMLLLAAQLARAWRLPIWMQVLIVVTGAFITPQYVNISPLYSSALFTLALIAWATASASLLLRSGKTRRGMEVIGALLIAMLLSLKVTVATFAALQLSILYLVLFAKSQSRGAVFKSAVITATLALLLVLPWFLAHWPTIHHASELAAAFRSEGLLPAAEPSIAAHDIPKLLSLRSLYYGDFLGAYHFLVLSCLGAAIVAIIIWRRHQAQAAGLLSAVSAGFAVLGVYLINAHMFAIENAVRYSAPVLIGSFTAMVLCLVRFTRADKATAISRLRYFGATAIMLVAIAVFAKTFTTRLQIGMKERRAFTFPVNADYLAYCRESFSPAEMARAGELQQKVPPGARMLVWAGTPFHLDFARNELMTVTDPGLINPALHFPLGITPEVFTFFLNEWKIQYVLIDISGFGIKDVGNLMWQAESEDAINKKLAERGIYLRRVLAAVGGKGEILFADKRTVVFKMPPVNLPNAGVAPAAKK